MNTKLVQSIREQRELGLTDNLIENSLISVGYSREEISETFKKLNFQSSETLSQNKSNALTEINLPPLETQNQNKSNMITEISLPPHLRNYLYDVFLFLLSLFLLLPGLILSFAFVQFFLSKDSDNIKYLIRALIYDGSGALVFILALIAVAGLHGLFRLRK